MKDLKNKVFTLSEKCGTVVEKWWNSEFKVGKAFEVDKYWDLKLTPDLSDQKF